MVGVDGGKLNDNEAKNNLSKFRSEMIKTNINCYFIGTIHSPKRKEVSAAFDKSRNYSNRNGNLANNNSEDYIHSKIYALRDPNLAENAINDLINMGDVVIPHIQYLLKDSNPNIRLYALKILKEIERNRLSG